MDQSAITVRIRFQDAAGNLVYQGDGTSNLRLWGAVFELGEELQGDQNEFYGFYRYIRSLGSAGDKLDRRYIYDMRSDAVTIGGTVPQKYAQTIGSFPVEAITFEYNKTALQGANKTVSGVTVTASDPDTVFAGDVITLLEI